MLTRGTIDVLNERLRQQKEEGWTAAHDDQYNHSSKLVMAATKYALHNLNPAVDGKNWWPWDLSWFKPKDQRSNLIKASALLLAEIDRIDRIAERRKDYGK